MLLVFVPLGTVPGPGWMSLFPGLRVRWRCCLALHQPGRFSRLVLQVLPGRDSGGGGGGPKGRAAGQVLLSPISGLLLRCGRPAPAAPSVVAVGRQRRFWFRFAGSLLAAVLVVLFGCSSGAAVERYVEGLLRSRCAY